MKTTLSLLVLLTCAIICHAQSSKAELMQTVQKQGIAQDLANTPDGVTIRLTPDGGFQIFATGTGTYDFDDIDDALEAQKEATLKAKANLSKFMNESLSTNEKFEEMSAKVKNISSDGEAASSKVDKVSVKSAFNSIKNSSAALLKGVIVLASSKIPEKGTTGTYRVMVGVSSKTLAAVGKLVEGTGQAGNPADGSTSTVATVPVSAETAQTSSSSGGQLPEGWIECIGQGSERETAVSAALTEGIQQVYGVQLQNDTKMKERMKKIKVNTKALRVSAKESESNTLTQTAGFVKEYKIIEVKDIGGGKLEARIHAFIINPRAGGVAAIMLYKPDMPLEDLTKNYDIGPKRRLSGSEIADVAGKTFNRAFSRANKFIVLDMNDLSNVVDQQKLSKSLVESGLAPGQELMKAGQLLTADYILTSTIEDIKYSRTIGMDKKTKKFGPIYKMSIKMNYKLTNVTTGQSLLSENISAILENDEIAVLLAEDEDADLLLALMGKVTDILNGRISEKQK